MDAHDRLGSVLDLSAVQMAARVRSREVSARELVQAHLARIEECDGRLHAVVASLAEQARAEAAQADKELAQGIVRGPLHGVPFSVKDSLNVAGMRTTSGTWGLRQAEPAAADATLVRRLREAGGILLAKTNLPDLLFSFETDNLVFGRTNNPHDVTRTPGGSSGGEAALIAAGGSPLGLGSDCLGSVRVPAAFCGIASLRPTSGRLPRTGHVPPLALWYEALWQLGPMARWTEDLVLAMQVLTGEDAQDWTAPPVPLLPAESIRRVAFFTHNGFAHCRPEIADAVVRVARKLESQGIAVDEVRPPNVEQAFDLEMALLGADGTTGLDAYLRDIGSDRVHPLLSNFVARFRPFQTDAAGFARLWHRWDKYKAEMRSFFASYDAVLCPVYTQTALPHGASMEEDNFRGFSYTMAWSVAGYPAATVRCGWADGLPVNVQVVAKPWRDLTALAVCSEIEKD